MEKFKVTTVVHKIGDNNQILIKDIVNESIEYSRNFGIDGLDFRIKNGDPEKSVDMGSYQGVEFLRLESAWDETDENLFVVKGQPAPFEYQINGGTNPWFKQTRLTIEDPSNIASLKIRNPDSANSKYIKVKVILSATGQA